MNEALLDLTSRIYTDFRFEHQSDHVKRRLKRSSRSGRGVCQDFAHLQIACLRSINIAARYVSGYLRTTTPPGQGTPGGGGCIACVGERLLPGIGWFGADPTNNVAPCDGHVTLAWGRDYGDVSPLRGLILGGGSHTLEVAVDMEPIES